MYFQDYISKEKPDSSFVDTPDFDDSTISDFFDDIGDKLNDDLKQTKTRDYSKKAEPDWSFENIRKATDRTDISNDFVRSVAENLDVFCDFEKEYLQKNCKWDILYSESVLRKIREEIRKQKKEDMKSNYEKWTKKREKPKTTQEQDIRERVRRGINQSPQYFLRDENL